jgi:hypothetical protein
MRLWIPLALVAATAASAAACPEPDYDRIASGGPIAAVIEGKERTDRITIRAVPSRPTLYFHRGQDETSAVPSFVDADTGEPIPFVLVPTGIAEYPFRFDLAMGAGTIRPTFRYRHERYEVEPGMTPHTTSVKVDLWNHYFRIVITSDAALLQFDYEGETYATPASEVMTRYFDSTDVRITAYYANGTREVIFGPKTLRPRETHDGRRVVVALLALLGLAGLFVAATRGPHEARDRAS